MTSTSHHTLHEDSLKGKIYGKELRRRQFKTLFRKQVVTNHILRYQNKITYVRMVLYYFSLLMLGFKLY